MKQRDKKDSRKLRMEKNLMNLDLARLINPKNLTLRMKLNSPIRQPLMKTLKKVKEMLTKSQTMILKLSQMLIGQKLMSN